MDGRRLRWWVLGLQLRWGDWRLVKDSRSVQGRFGFWDTRQIQFASSKACRQCRMLLLEIWFFFLWYPTDPCFSVRQPSANGKPSPLLRANTISHVYLGSILILTLLTSCEPATSILILVFTVLSYSPNFAISLIHSTTLSATALLCPIEKSCAMPVLSISISAFYFAISMSPRLFLSWPLVAIKASRCSFGTHSSSSEE